MRSKAGFLLVGGELLLAAALAAAVFGIAQATTGPNAVFLAASVLSLTGGLCFVAGAAWERRIRQQAQPVPLSHERVAEHRVGGAAKSTRDRSPLQEAA